MLPSTDTLAPGALLRLTLEERAWLTSAARLSRTLYEGMGNVLPVHQIAQPTIPADGIWLQDVRVQSGAGTLVVSSLVSQIERAYPVRVRDLRRINATDIAGTVAAVDRERELRTAQLAKASESKLPAWLQQVVNVARTLRAVFVLVLVVALLWFAWPWVWPWLRSLRQRKTR